MHKGYCKLIIIIVVLTIFNPTRLAGPKLFGDDFTKNEIIQKYLSGRELEPIEGIWNVKTEESEIELAIMKNSFDTNIPYDYIGLATSSNCRWWTKGDVRLFLKRSVLYDTYDSVLMIGAFRITNEHPGTLRLTRNTFQLSYLGKDLKLIDAAGVRSYPKIENKANIEEWSSMSPVEVATSKKGWINKQIAFYPIGYLEDVVQNPDSYFPAKISIKTLEGKVFVIKGYYKRSAATVDLYNRYWKIVDEKNGEVFWVMDNDGDREQDYSRPFYFISEVEDEKQLIEDLKGYIGKQIWYNFNAETSGIMDTYLLNHLEPVTITAIEQDQFFDKIYISLKRQDGSIKKIYIYQVLKPSDMPRRRSVLKELNKQFYFNNIFEEYGWDEETWDLIKNRYIKIGWNEDQCILSWGYPNRVNRTTSYWGTSEQWVYGSRYVYFENGILSAIQD